MQPILRSYLYCSGTRLEQHFDKAIHSNADAVIIELEDGIAHNKKSTARHAVVERLENISVAKPVFVRINSFDSGLAIDDLEALASLPLTGIRIAKVSCAEEVKRAAHILRKYQFKGNIQLMIESACALSNINDIVQADPMVSLVTLGEADFCADVFCDMDSRVIDYARSQVVIASRTADLLPPVLSGSRFINDDDFVTKTSLHAKNMGFWGRTCIHPSQIDIVNKVFTISSEEIEYAQHVIKLMNEAFLQGQTTVVDGDNNYINIWTKRRAERILFLAGIHIRGKE